MSVTANPQFALGIRETLETGVDAATVKTVVHSGFDLNNTSLNATSTPPVSKQSSITHALSAGAKTIDFTALAGTNGATLDCTGLKLQGILVSNPAGNATINIAPGSSNPYPIFGAANDIDVPAGSKFAFYFADTLADVSSTVKTLDITGTGTEEFDLQLLFG